MTQIVTEALNLYTASALLTLPGITPTLLIALSLTAKFLLAGLVVARTGRTFLWGLLVLVPLAELLTPWLLAYVRWPVEKPVAATVTAGS